MGEAEAPSSEVESSSKNQDQSIGKGIAIPDVNDTAMQLERAEEVYKGHVVDCNRPGKAEVWVWYLYELCSYFILTTLVPVLFPLIISQIKGMPIQPGEPYWEQNDKGFNCRSRQIDLYRALTRPIIPVGGTHFSALKWTSFSWGLGLILAASILSLISTHLDYGRSQLLIAASAIGIGSFFCLPTGFFNVAWIFPPYIAAIIAANTVAAASHTRHLGLMVRRFAGPTIMKERFQFRRGVSSWLSLYAIAAGGIGSALMSTFTYYMLRKKEKFVSLWVVSIFSGLTWAAGIIFAIFVKPGTANTSTISAPAPLAHYFSIFRYPQALGGLIVALLGTFTTMCIFTSVALYLVGELCFRPLDILYLWLTYFLVPLVSLPITHPLQQLLKANAVKMNLLGFLLSLSTTGVGFFYRGNTWQKNHVFPFAAIQSTSAGLLHAFERVLVMDCCPEGREGAFAGWLSWFRTAGGLLGFAVASAMPGNVSSSFGVAFCAAVVGSLVLVYGNISDLGGAVAAKNVITYDEEDGSIGVGIGKEGSPEQRVDASAEIKKHRLEDDIA